MLRLGPGRGFGLPPDRFQVMGPLPLKASQVLLIGFRRSGPISSQNWSLYVRRPGNRRTRSIGLRVLFSRRHRQPPTSRAVDGVAHLAFAVVPFRVTTRLFPSAARRSGRAGALVGGHADQSYPQILTVAVGLPPRILYWIFTDVRRPLRPGASVAAVSPPSFRVPTGERRRPDDCPSQGLRLMIWTSAPSTESFTCLTSFLPSIPLRRDLRAGIGGLERLRAHHKPLVNSGAVHSPQ